RNTSRKPCPTFRKEVYTIVVTPGQTNQVLKKITATDPDGDVLVYSIEPPEFRNLFAVDAERPTFPDGTDLTELKTSRLYSFRVVARTTGDPIMSTFTNIRVRVQENDAAVVTSNAIEGTVSTVPAQTTSRLPSTLGGSSTGSENSLETTSTLETTTSTTASTTTQEEADHTSPSTSAPPR
ncbi:hypothetical protein OSTOST_10233, partial [Ostertagia ostertagi]